MIVIIIVFYALPYITPPACTPKSAGLKPTDVCYFADEKLPQVISGLILMKNLLWHIKAEK